MNDPTNGNESSLVSEKTFKVVDPMAQTANMALGNAGMPSDTDVSISK